ncbi:MAG: dicarboxylate/amino acid:cation symporter [Candidatus Eremiobacteraeota bacterium]|nr:dicarboxylate/amino acid:cation symporter [Candidatus Eremiobacteraeota bacterium]
MPWYKKLHWQIIIAMILGLIYGLIASRFGWVKFTEYWIKPWGTIFINLLKLIAMPMILASLVTGIASLSDLTKLSRIGGKTIGLYIITTIIAVILALLVANAFKSTGAFSGELRKQLKEMYAGKIQEKQDIAAKQIKKGPLQSIVNIIPQNAVDAASNNRNMLQMVFLAILIGIGLVKSNKEKTGIISKIFESANELILRIVELIMVIAPFGVFAQLASVITELAGNDPANAMRVLKALGLYLFMVILALFLHVMFVYIGMLKLFTKISIKEFFKAIQPAMLIAFSTSSSAATLPITMECCEKELGLPEEITSFTLPVGATVNMDGTSIYQAISVVFIAHIMGINLTFMDQITVILTCTLASIGAAGVPGAGVVMLVIVMQAINIPIEGIALVLGVERIIDMFRSVVNITGDSAVTCVVSQSEGNRTNSPTALESKTDDNPNL